MTQEQQKGNEIIARSGYSAQANLQIEHFTDSGNEYGLKEYLHNLSFHSNWNALIEVWAKVYQELMVLQESGKITDQEYLDLCCDCEDGFNMGKIEQSFSVTIQAIELINIHKITKP